MSEYHSIYWTAKDHCQTVATLHKHDLRSLSFYFSVSPSVCSGTARHSFDHKIVTTTYLESEWPSLDIPKTRFLKNCFFSGVIALFLIFFKIYQ